ncbi:MAG TPA: hypothetical protein VL443_05575 [Cyclobacteriaceae bacterium]|jgi:hypothetical protein|nr:hypothetical protein [Cyclobacteriaceae bacterium]
MGCRKSLFTIFITSALCFQGFAQIIDVRKTAQNEAVYRTNQAINTGINTGINAIFNAPGKIYRKIKQNKQQTGNTYPNYPTQGDQPINNNTNNTGNNYPTTVPTINVNTIYGTDFTAGNTLYWSDDFASATIGQLPGNWQCTGSGEVRTVNDKKWLQLSGDGLFSPQSLKNLPENFGLEWDALFNPAPTPDAHYIIYLYSSKDKQTDLNESNYPGNYGVYFAFNTLVGEVDAETFENGKNSNLDFHLVTDALKASLTNQIHIAIRKESTRISLYLNGHEVFSSLITAPALFDTLKFGSFYMNKDDFMLISNLKVTTY